MKKLRLHYLSSKEYSIWDNLVEASPLGTLFHTTSWLETVAPEDSKVLGCFRDDNLIAGMPLVDHKRFGLRYISHPPLTPWMGIVFQSWKNDIKLIKKLTLEKEISHHFAQWIKNMDYFIQSFHPNFRDWQPMMWEGFSCQPYYTYVLTPLRKIDTIWKGLRENHRRNIKDAVKMGFSIQKNIPEEEYIKNAVKLFLPKGKQLGCSEVLLKRLHQRFSETGKCAFFMAVDKNGHSLAGTYIVWDNKSSYYLLGGTDKDRAGRSGMAMTFLIWEVIKEMAQYVNCFDFEGSDIPGVEKFFRGFGGEQIPYFRLSYIGSRRLAVYECLKKLIASLKK